MVHPIQYCAITVYDTPNTLLCLLNPVDNCVWYMQTFKAMLAKAFTAVTGGIHSPLGGNTPGQPRGVAQRA